MWRIRTSQEEGKGKCEGQAHTSLPEYLVLMYVLGDCLSSEHDNHQSPKIGLNMMRASLGVGILRK